ncbi:hypothetical protein [Streptomyces triticirhizae]|uniref:Uncharacterized protein n=1 Tax=Streptomyces triticirhizae TaxID=2483353 RepID=A0A3M2LIE3_9ACTN|nr:hypothetical protein [Streptomyces triticirhizae]RMI37201.1 hypothetical protein EBN88_19640 [Streptomyces triticirhizae]
MKDHEIIQSFAGQEHVSLTVHHAPARVVAIAHEYGYALDDYLMTVRPVLYRTMPPLTASPCTNNGTTRGDNCSLPSVS